MSRTSSQSPPRSDSDAVSQEPDEDEPKKKKGDEAIPEIRKVVTSLPVDHFGTAVYVKGWLPGQAHKHPLLIVHDLGENVGLYRASAKLLVGQGFAVYGFDLRGHGRSGRRLGHAPSYNILIKDLLQVVAWVRHKEGGRDPILIGQGIGALIALDFTKTYGRYCRAAVLSAPCLKLSSTVSATRRILIKALAEVSPMVRIPTAISPRFTKDLRESRGDAGLAPKQPFPRLTAIFTHELLQAIRRAQSGFVQFDSDVLIMCPENDTICDYTDLRKAAAIHASHNLHICNLPAVGHVVFTDSSASRQVAMEILIPWLQDIVRQSPPHSPKDDRVDDKLSFSDDSPVGSAT